MSQIGLTGVKNRVWVVYGLKRNGCVKRVDRRWDQIFWVAGVAVEGINSSED